ncbi:MAG: hypothetical protein RQ866_07040 [Bacteroidales bacterium]|nr:hypothetical protein [Bacteroidales bacterium]
MKQFITPLLTGILFWCAVPGYSQYQKSAEYVTIGANAGVGVISVLLKGIVIINSELNEFMNTSYLTIKKPPVFQLSGDYHINKNISIGIAGAYHPVSISWDDPDIPSVDNDGRIGDFEMSLNRINIGIRGLIHYDYTDNVDLYSGIRLGVNIWNVNFSSHDPEINEGFHALNNFPSGIMPGFQIIPFGITVYLEDIIGLNAEFCIGQPYFLTAGVKMKF